MSDDEIDVLDELATRLEGWVIECQAHLMEYPNARVQHAVTNAGAAVVGIRMAIKQIEAKAERAERSQVNKQAWAAGPKYDELTMQLAKQRGIEPAEMQAIRDEAAKNARRAAAAGPLDQQLANAPSVNPVPHG